MIYESQAPDIAVHAANGHSWSIPMVENRFTFEIRREKECNVLLFKMAMTKQILGPLQNVMRKCQE